MFVRSLRNLLTLNPGFQPKHLLLTRVDFSHLHLPKERRTDFMAQLVTRAKQIPGVEAVSEVQNAPISGGGWDGSVLSPNSGQQIIGTTDRNRAAPDYFHTMETPVLAGREFTENDMLTSPRVAIVNEAYVKKFLNGENALGKIARLEAPPGRPPDRYEIVGIVKDSTYMQLQEFPPTIYFPIAQNTEPGQGIELILRSKMPMVQLVPELRGAMAALSPEIELNSRTYEALIREYLLGDRAMAELSTFFGAVALLLAAIGLYGVISYMVARRTNEIGIRMALGAQRRDILSMVLREAGILLGVGLIAGSVLSYGLARLISSLLFELKANDPLSIVLGTAVLAIVVLLSSVFPARRAASLDPTVALRHE